jgi:nucleoside-diphosphate-sugar epimerase
MKVLVCGEHSFSSQGSINMLLDMILGLERAMQNKPLPITGTGQETRDFTSVNDIISGLISIYESPDSVGEAFNLAAAREIKIIDLANLINELTGNTSGVTYMNRRNWDTKSRILASNEKARSKLGFNPNQNFVEEIKFTIKWFKNNWEMIVSQIDDPGFYIK